MRIAFVNSTRHWGGVKTWMLTFAKELCKKNHFCYIYGRQAEFVDAAKASVGHGEYVTFGPDMNPIAIKWFLQEFRKKIIDVVIINVGKDLSTAGLAAKLLGIPVIQRIGLPQDISYRWKTRLLHWYICPLFLSPCQYIADGFLESLPYVAPKDIAIILNGKKVLDSAFEEHYPLKFVCTQQLEPDKGHMVLLEAFSKVKGDFELHIWGTGSLEQFLKEHTQKLGLSSKVFFRGFSANISKALLEGDVFLLASFREGLPNTLLEAMAVGLLPIVRLVGGISEVLTQKMYTWVLPYSAATEDFQVYIQKAIELSKEDLFLYRNYAREACKKNFNIDNQIVVFEKWLYGVINDRYKQ